MLRNIYCFNTLIGYRDYEPFGAPLSAKQEKNRLGFIDKEQDKESSLADHGVRKYDYETGRFMSVDALWGEFLRWSPYQYSGNDPLSKIDENGKYVHMVFSKSSHLLLVEDMDNHKDGLQVKFVTSKDYLYNGIRDEKGNLQYNQILLIGDAFSGGSVDGNCSIDKNNTDIPKGFYSISEYEGETTTKWFKLDAFDDSPYDDIATLDGEKRSGFRLHLGTKSDGCVTVCSNNSDNIDSYTVLCNILSFTSTGNVPKREGLQKYNLFSGTRTEYGLFSVCE